MTDPRRLQIVDIQDINVEKENIIPLLSGRKAAALSEKFKEPSSMQRSQTFEEERRRLYESRIENLNLETEDDPLDIHFQYVKWMQEECTFGHAELMKVIERAVRLFRKDERYKNDPRYLKLWLMVAKNTKEPAEVFKYLSVNRIGIQNATFYEEYSSYMMSVKRYSDAGEILEQGVSKRAEPYERLLKRFNEFKMMDLKNEVSLTEAQFHHNAATADIIRASSLQSTRGQRIESSSQQQLSYQKGSIAVYKDGEDGQSNILPDESNAVWDDYSALSFGKKENKVKTEKMAGATLRQSTTADLLSSKIEKPEFRVFKDEQMKTFLSEPQHLSSLPTKKERIVCDLSLLYICDEEFSLEEIRALRLGYSLMDDEPNHYSMPSPSTPFKSSFVENKKSAPAIDHEGLLYETNLGMKRNSDSMNEPFVMKNMQLPLSMNSRQVASPTINTRNAMEDVFQMFNQSIVTEADAEDVTISSKVYRSEIIPFTIPIHMDDDEMTAPTSSASAVRKENVGFQKDRMPLQRGLGSQRLPLKSKTLKSDELEHNYVFQGAPIKEYPIESTPYNNRALSNPKNVNLQRIPQNFDLMTPIAEASFEDGGLTGFSTIKRVSLQDCDHTTTTIGNASILVSREHSSLEQNPSVSFFDDCSPKEMSEYPATAKEYQTAIDANGYQSSNESDVDSSYKTIHNRPLTPVNRSHNRQEVNCEDESDFAMPCNPRSNENVVKMMAKVFPSLKTMPNLYDCREHSSDNMNQLFSFENGKQKKNHKRVRIELAQVGAFDVTRMIGEGAFAKVYLLEEVDAGQSENEMLDDDQRLSALKIHRSPFPWEFYILSQLHKRLSNKARESVVSAYSCHVYDEHIHLRLSYFGQGTLVDCVNYAIQDGYGASVSAANASHFAGVDELLAMYWTIELMQLMIDIHEAGILHGDVKADNVLVRIRDECSLVENRLANSETRHQTNWDSLYHANGSNGWISKGICLLDWGSAIDTTLFPSSQRFVSPMDKAGSNDKPHSSKDKMEPGIECWEARNGYSWKYEVDWYGVAGIAHVLLFGKYMGVKEDDFSAEQRLSFYNEEFLNAEACPHLSPTSSLKRYWQVSLWTRLFDLLMNAGAYNRMLLHELPLTFKSSESECKSSDINSKFTAFNSKSNHASSYQKEFPLLQEINSLKSDMEQWLTLNCNKSGKSLKNLLRKVEVSSLERQ